MKRFIASVGLCVLSVIGLTYAGSVGPISDENDDVRIMDETSSIVNYISGRFPVDALITAIGPGVIFTAEPFDLAVAKGDIAKHRALNKFGSNTSIKSTAFESIVSHGGIYDWATAAQVLEIFSSDSDDTAAGTGARKIIVSSGLDSNYDEMADQEVTLNGTTPVDVHVSNTYLRQSRAWVSDQGSSETNEGTITIRQKTSLKIMSTIEPLKGQTLLAIWTVPNGHKLYLKSYYFTSENSQPAVVEMYKREFGGAFRIQHRLDIGSSLPIGEIIPFKFLGKTDIDMRGLAQTGQHRVAAGFSGYIVED